MSTDGALQDLGDGLILRRTTVEDTEGLIAFHCAHHPPPGAAGSVEYIEAWLCNLMAGSHPKHVFDGDALFPDLTFQRLLFGQTSLQELETLEACCGALNDHGRALVRFLFPKRASIQEVS